MITNKYRNNVERKKIGEQQKIEYRNTIKYRIEIEIRSKGRRHRRRPKEEGKGGEEEKENQNNRCELSEHEPKNKIS